MAVLPSLAQVAGGHVELYEAYFHQVDKNGTGNISALDAASFLKKSGLSDAVLSKVWDLSDPTGRGFLDKQSFFVSLKLISLAQNGQEVCTANIIKEVPPPNMGEQPYLDTVIEDWSIKPAERLKFDQLFDSLGPVGGKLPGSKVKPVMLNSKLPLETLGRVWDLSDTDKDGFLDREEFVLAMHLIYKALENHPVPAVLPPNLIPPSKRKKSLPGAVPVLPNVMPNSDSAWTSPAAAESSEIASKNVLNKQVSIWVVSAAEKKSYDEMFRTADLDGDGFVNGMEIKDLFLQSGLPQPVLAHIWNLCDMKQTGKLNMEQFALAMYLVQQKLKGTEPPTVLPPEMIPPTLRPKPGTEGSDSGVNSNSSSYSNPELEMVGKEIDELTKEKQQLEQEVAQKQADIQIQNGEIKSLQTELDTLTAALKQLEMQKGEAQKRLDDLDAQTSSVANNLSDLQKQVDDEAQEVNKLKQQLLEQEKSLKDQESELNSKREELNELRQEEAKLEQQIESSKNQLNTLNKTMEDTQINISQTKAKITLLQEQQRQLSDAVNQYDSAISSGDASTLSEVSLNIITPNFSDLDYQRIGNTAGSSPLSVHSGFSTGTDDFQEDPFKSKDPFGAVNGFGSDPFSGEDPFKNEDPFRMEAGGVPAVDPFGGNDPFRDAFGGGSDDPFKKDNEDPFTSTFSKAQTSSDPFDPFGVGDFNSKMTANVSATNGDPFGGDPFAPTAMAPRSESPTPALPPKKSRQPPPRPAPPKNPGVRIPRAAPPAPEPFCNSNEVEGSTHPDPFASAFGSDPFDPFASSAGKDPFAASSGATDSFADFANFDKLCGREPSEEEQLVWATEESLRLERDRQQEQADLELALALSKAESEKQL